MPAFSSPRYASSVLIGSNAQQPYKITISKLFENKHYGIEMHSSPALRQLLIGAGPGQKKVYRFYLFDIDGRLKVQVNIEKEKKTSVVNISRGNYFYEIFNEDERIENGQLTVE